MFKPIIKLLRPQQWTKNLFVFLPLFFDKHLMDWNYFLASLYAFLSFSFVASSIYCFNDIWDVESDRLHPQKCKRPIASGALSISNGYIIMAMMMLLSFVTLSVGFRLNFDILLNVGMILAFYIVLNILYCVKLKQIAIIDVFIVALGFVLRVLVGGLATNILLSKWIILMTFLLALFLALAKRRDDVVMYNNTGVKVRKNVSRYGLQFLNQAITIVSTMTLICYLMYTISPEVILRTGNDNLYLTSIWVLLGIMRYIQITIVDVKSGSPTKILFHDHFIQFSIVGWMLTFFMILYVL